MRWKVPDWISHYDQTINLAQPYAQGPAIIYSHKYDYSSGMAHAYKSLSMYLIRHPGGEW